MFSSTETIVSGVGAMTRLRGGDGRGRIGVVGGGPTANWNIAPTHTVPVVREFVQAGQAGQAGDDGDDGDPALTLGPASWGYPAPWKKGLVLFNARGESVFDKPSFRGSQPCLFIMDGWYEWHEKRPYLVTGPGLLVVAGLCRPAREGEGLDATIITTASAGPVGWLHDRMPRVLGIAGIAGPDTDGDISAVGAAEVHAWLSGTDDDRRTLAASTPGGDVLDMLATREVDRRVGNVANNDAGLIDGVSD